MSTNFQNNLDAIAYAASVATSRTELSRLYRTTIDARDIILDWIANHTDDDTPSVVVDALKNQAERYTWTILNDILPRLT